MSKHQTSRSGVHADENRNKMLPDKIIMPDDSMGAVSGGISFVRAVLNLIKPSTWKVHKYGSLTDEASQEEYKHYKEFADTQNYTGRYRAMAMRTWDREEKVRWGNTGWIHGGPKIK